MPIGQSGSRIAEWDSGGAGNQTSCLASTSLIKTPNLGVRGEHLLEPKKKLRGAWITFRLFHEQATGFQPAITILVSCWWLLQYVSMFFGVQVGCRVAECR